LSTPALRALAAFTWLAAFTVVPVALAAAYAAQLHLPAYAVGLLMAADPLGFIVGAAIIPKITPARRPALLGPLAIGSMAPMIAFVAHPPLVVACALLFIVGTGAYSGGIATDLFSGLVPDARRGEAFGFSRFGLIAVQGLGAAAGGGLAELLHPSGAIALAGAVGTGLALLIALSWHRHRPHTTKRRDSRASSGLPRAEHQAVPRDASSPVPNDNDLARRAPTEQRELPITIYLADGQTHEQVEAAVEETLTEVGLQVTERQDSITGSWLRHLRARLRNVADTPAGREAMALGLHALEQRLALEKDAEITEKLMANLGSVITSLQPERDAVVRMGAVLVVKADGVVTALQLTVAQQLILNHRPQLFQSPRDLLAKLEAGPEPGPGLEDGEGPAAIEP
jgi:hypothetical protein